MPDPTNDTTQPQAPFSDALNSALDEVDRLTQKRDAARDALDSIPDDGKHTGERSRAAQSLQEFENQLSISSRKVTEILRQQGQVSSRPGSTSGTSGTSGRSSNNDRPGYRSYTDANGNLYESWTGHPWSQATDASGNPIVGRVPGSSTAATKPTASDPSKWVPIPAPDGRVIAMQDPATGDRVAVPAEPSDRNSPKGSTKQTIDSGRTITWTADGNGNWSIQNIGDAIQDPNKPKEGDTRPNVSSGYQIREVYRGGQWVTDPTFTPVPYSPDVANKPKEGDTRPNVQGGYSVQEVYRGGQWVVDPSVAPKPYTPQPPRDVSAPANQQYIVQQDPATGKTTNIENPNYQAADPAGRVAQLQRQAQAQRDAINARVLSGDLTQEQAAQQFDTWWNANIEPQKAQIAQAQAMVQADAQRKQEEQQRLNYSTASAAGDNTVKAYEATLPYRVGPGFGAAVNNLQQAYSSGKAPGNMDLGAAVTYDMPDLGQMAQQATAQALAHISPTAAGMMGGPMPGVPQGIDVGSALNESQYKPGATTTIAPDGTVTIQHSTPGSSSQPDFAAQSINDPSRGPQLPSLGVYRPPQLAPPVGPMGGPLM